MNEEEVGHDLALKRIFMTLANSASDKQTFLASNFSLLYVTVHPMFRLQINAHV